MLLKKYLIIFICITELHQVNQSLRIKTVEKTDQQSVLNYATLNHRKIDFYQLYSMYIFLFILERFTNMAAILISCVLKNILECL